MIQDNKQQDNNNSNDTDTRNVQTKSIKSRLGAIPPLSKLSLNNTIPKPNAETLMSQSAAHPQQQTEKVQCILYLFSIY